MKIWFDVLTPKQVLFFEPMISRLDRDHGVLCTSRIYNEVTKLAKIRKLNLTVIGRHGGAEKYEKLIASSDRIKKLTTKIKKFSPDVAISFCSPEAARVAYGLGIKHIAFCDSPHAEAVMRLSVPLIQKLLTPWIIPKNEFAKYGISTKNIIQYRAIDAAPIAKRKISDKHRTKHSIKKKSIIIRFEEEQAAYTKKNQVIIPMIKKIIKEFSNEEIIILGRYASQINLLKKIFGKNAKILNMPMDGKVLLERANVFVGSGGTMTAESALLGIPTISYHAAPNLIEDYLVRKKLIKIITNPNQIVSTINNVMSNHKKIQNKAKKELNSMTDPYQKLIPLLKNK